MFIDLQCFLMFRFLSYIYSCINHETKHFEASSIFLHNREIGWLGCYMRIIARFRYHFLRVANARHVLFFRRILAKYRILPLEKCDSTQAISVHVKHFGIAQPRGIFSPNYHNIYYINLNMNFLTLTVSVFPTESKKITSSKHLFQFPNM